MGFDEADIDPVHHCDDFVKHSYIAIRRLGAVSDDDAGAVFECDALAT